MTITRAEVFAAIKTMSVSDRIDLLDERIAHADAHPEDVMTWEQIEAKLDAER